MKRVIFLLVSLLLSGCVAAVVAGATGMVVYDKRSMKTMESDARIFHVIHQSIVRDPRFNDSRIVVVSFNHIVLLLGQTPSDSLRALAEKKAESIPSVQRVYDEITIGYPLSLTQKTKDSLITSQARTYMLSKKGLESGSIRIVTENGVIYLMGIATTEQAHLAANVAREVSGVKKVVKVFKRA